MLASVERAFVVELATLDASAPEHSLHPLAIEDAPPGLDEASIVARST